MIEFNFASDYTEGALPQVIKRLSDTNLMQTEGYGTDRISLEAENKIRKAAGCPGALVQFLVGGTQTNATVIDAVLRLWQGVVACQSGHIAVHEAGAVEFGGHKVLTLPAYDGKLRAEDVDALCLAHENNETKEHEVEPGMVYISQPTELGTLYSLKELEALSLVCRKWGLPLYADGARLAYALACPDNDVSLKDLARLCDIFYIGGTKCGALLGEAVVCKDPALMPHFFTIVKQHGALLAKGRLLGIMFDTLFTDDLYLEAGRNGIETAERMKQILAGCGLPFAIDSPTNQIFVTMPNDLLEKVKEFALLTVWGPHDQTHTDVRLVTSWATRMETVEAFGRKLKDLCQ